MNNKIDINISNNNLDTIQKKQNYEKASYREPKLKSSENIYDIKMTLIIKGYYCEIS